MRSSIGQVWYVKTANILGKAFYARDVGRREIGLPPAVTKTNELIANPVYTREFVLFYTYTRSFNVTVNTGVRA